MATTLSLLIFFVYHVCLVLVERVNTVIWNVTRFETWFWPFQPDSKNPPSVLLCPPQTAGSEWARRSAPAQFSTVTSLAPETSLYRLERENTAWTKRRTKQLHAAGAITSSAVTSIQDLEVWRFPLCSYLDFVQLQI